MIRFTIEGAEDILIRYEDTYQRKVEIIYKFFFSREGKFYELYFHTIPHLVEEKYKIETHFKEIPCSPKVTHRPIQKNLVDLPVRKVGSSYHVPSVIRCEYFNYDAFSVDPLSVHHEKLKFYFD